MMPLEILPLERAMSGVFHRDTSETGIRSVPSRMSMQERREFHKSHNPEWVLKEVTKKGNNPLKEFGTAALRGFVMAYSGKFILGVLFGLLGGRKKIMDVLRESASHDTLRFATFFSVYNGLLHGVNALMCNMRKKADRTNAVIAGIVASFALLIDGVERRQIVSIYAFVRAVSVLVKALSRERYLPYYEHAESVIFGLINVPIMYGFLLEPDLLDPGYYRWILGMGAVNDKGLTTTLRHRRNHFFATRELLPFQPCQPHYHEGSCVGYCSHDWFLGLGRAFKIYLPVHVLPLLIFRYKKLFKDPKKSVKETAKGLLLSCMFLTTYQFNVKFSQCMLRNARQTDEPIHAAVAGMLTGLACLFERPSRVSELMLYCVPKSLEACWNYGRKYWGFQSVPYFELPLFAFGNAVLMSALKEDLKSTYFNALAFIVTGKFAKSEEKKKESTREKTEIEEEEEH